MLATLTHTHTKKKIAAAYGCVLAAVYWLAAPKQEPERYSYQTKNKKIHPLQVFNMQLSRLCNEVKYSL